MTMTTRSKTKAIRNRLSKGYKAYPPPPPGSPPPQQPTGCFHNFGEGFCNICIAEVINHKIPELGGVEVIHMEAHESEEEEEKEIPWCYENGKNSAPIPCGCPQPCCVPESSDEEEDESDWCYGEAKVIITKEYIMAGGGSHAWNYQVEFDNEGIQRKVFITRYGQPRVEQRGKELLRHQEEEQKLLLVDKGTYYAYMEKYEDWLLIYLEDIEIGY